LLQLATMLLPPRTLSTRVVLRVDRDRAGDRHGHDDRGGNRDRH
jgi:hypothetical protein